MDYAMTLVTGSLVVCVIGLVGLLILEGRR